VNVRPDTTFETTLEAGVTGLVGTIALKIIDNEGGETVASSTATIIETPSGSGFYAATRTSPTDAGQYTIMWSTDGTYAPDTIATDELFVTSTAPSASVGTIPYIDASEFIRVVLKNRTPTTEQSAAIDRVLIAAAIEINAEVQPSDDDPLNDDELNLAAQVNLARAIEHWESLPFGINPLGGEVITGVAFQSKSSWDRHAHTLAPLKRDWGFA